MTSLLSLLAAYPILETLVTVLPLGDLFNLSKTNSKFRAALHGFYIGRSPRNPSSLKAVRPALFIGRHNTPHWKNLKAKSPLCCSEPQHTRGAKIKGCLMCSMPVCEACIIKASFGKRDENTFPNRVRSLCVECFASGNPHQETSLNGEEILIPNSYLVRPECICLPKYGHLCLQCKLKQKSSFEIRDNQCYGLGCSKSKSDGFGGRVCLWCDLPLPRKRSRAESRRDYDARYLLARTHSTYGQPTEEGHKDDIIDPAEQEAIWASSSLTLSASELTRSSKQARPVAYERFEDERRSEFEGVSEGRQSIASADEEQRLRKSEAPPCSGSIFRAPPPARIQGPGFFLAAGNSTGSRSDSAESTLAPEDDSSLPSYDSCTHGSLLESFPGSSPPRP